MIPHLHLILVIVAGVFFCLAASTFIVDVDRRVRVLAVGLFAVVLSFIFTSCATNSPDAAKNSRARAFNQTLSEAGSVLGKVAVSTLLNVVQQETNGGNVDFAHAASFGLNVNATNVLTSGAIERIVNAYSGESLPATAVTARQVFAGSDASAFQKAAAIANVISAVAMSK